MGIFRQFPYTNFHEMNLDSVIKIMLDIQNEWNDTKEIWENYEEFINNYFDNLDLTEETLEVIEKLINDGTMSEIIDPSIIRTVNSWILQHVRTTTPIVDESLNIRGAAADSKTVGDKFRTFNEKKINKPLDENSIPYNGSNGQFLRSNGSDFPEWVDLGLPTDEQIQTAIDNWLDAHPEATLNVEDHSITDIKLTTELYNKILNYYVTPEMFGAIGDGVSDDTVAVRTALEHDCVYLSQNYHITELIETSASLIFGFGSLIADVGALDCNNNVIIKDISIINSTGTALTCNADANISNIKIDGGQCGITCGPEYTNKIFIFGCEITHINGAGSWGINSIRSDFLTIKNCYIDDVKTTLGYDADGIRFFKQDNVGSKPVIIDNCVIHNCDGRHIKDQSSNSIITNCCLYNDADYSTYITEFRSIDLQYGGRHIVDNNRIITPRYGVYIQQGTRTTNTVISNNSVHSYNYYALVISTTGAEYNNIVKIINNTLESEVTNAIRMYSAPLNYYLFKDNVINTASTGYPVRIDNWDVDNRIELINNSTTAAQLFSPGYRVLNLYSEPAVLINANDITFESLLPYGNIRFNGKISDVTDITANLLIKKDEQAITLSGAGAYRIYGSAGRLLIQNI